MHAAYNRVGITSIGERAASVAGFRTYEALRKASRLHVRATVTIRIPNPRDPASVEAFFRDLPLAPRAGDEWLKAGPLKIIADGGILAGTSFMREPYGPPARALYGVDDPAYRGFLTITREQIAAAVEAGASRGWQMAAHVTGDAGVDAVLDAFEAAQTRHPSADPRHTLIHAYFVNAGDRGEGGPARRPGRYPARVVLQGRRRAVAGAGRSAGSIGSSASARGSTPAW